ncbi:regulatory protein AfsR [Longispora fulva]|uniref:DNA-binding SARP family transcriptional activator n=1 Tax=Longispora fulva TaxID=619741 RepID=A0A8J7KF29_9ACTN|nr:BTAD domain-containing putative transcriptional regulator [Longispora fulva]MBG6135660.1 DNA-binding SARP family transcriptional activator [Longispora fulva]GIG56101.1 regulatory protein AfsR [Longispora fulva]
MTEFAILGPLVVREDGRELAIAGPRQRTLLAALLLRAPGHVSTDELCDLIWADGQPADAPAALHVLVNRLRQRLGKDRILTRNPGYILQIDAGELDAAVFRGQLDAARAAIDAGQWERAGDLAGDALRLWRAEPLADVPSDDLCRDERHRLHALRLEALEVRVQADLQRGRHDGLVVELQDLTREHPLRERFHAQLILALYRTGRQSEALAGYLEARRILITEGGVEPGSELRDLHQRILANDPALELTETPARLAGPPVPTQLPADVADFTGRAGQAAELGRLLTTAGSQVVLTALAGAGGIGKTTLAVHVGHLFRDQFGDGQLYVNLRAGGVTPLAPGEVLARFLRGLGVAPTAIPTEEDERGALYRSMLADRRVLVVLDDAVDAGQVRPLLPGTGDSAVLITSRGRLAGLDGVHRMTLEVLDDAEALALFERILGPDQARVDLEASAEVVRMCAGLPLAIRLAAGRLVAELDWTVRTLADRLADQSRRLDELAVEDRAVRGSLAVGHRRLSAESARVFRLLGLWHGPDLDRRAAGALVGRDPETAEGLLRALSGVYLLDNPEPDRYAFHDLVRIYASERAAAEESPAGRRDAVRRLLTWYLHGAAAASGQLSPVPLRLELPELDPGLSPASFTDRKSALAWFETERVNLIAAADQARAEGFDELAWMLPAAVRAFLHLRGHWTDYVHLFRAGLDAARRLGDLRGEGRMLNGLGIVYHALFRVEEALDCYQRAVDIRRADNDRQGEAMALANLGNTLSTLGRYDEAIPVLNRGLALAREVGDHTAEGNALNNLGVAYGHIDQTEAAADSYLSAIEAYRSSGHRERQGATMNALGVVRRTQGDRAEALRLMHEALAIHQELGARHQEASALLSIGDTLCQDGQTPEGRSHWFRAMDILDEIGDPRADALRAHLASLTPDVRSTPNLWAALR